MELFRRMLAGGKLGEAAGDPLRQLMQREFNVMFLPLFQLWEGEEPFTLKVPYGGGYLCRWEPYPRRGLDARYCRERMRAGCCVLVEVEGLGSFLFTDHRHSDIFQGVQRSFREVRSFVFCGNGTGGYFKILENGRIRRKIASYLVMDGIGNNPETRGAPCEYERETGHIYRTDPKAERLKDVLPGFGLRELWQLFDYYVGREKFRVENVRAVRVCRLQGTAG